jgi:hypothetical protein
MRRAAAVLPTPATALGIQLQQHWRDTVRSIFHHPRSAAPEFSPGEQVERIELLATLSARQQTEALRFLSGYAPAVFDAILDAVDPHKGDNPGEEYEPACAFCGERAAIFTWFGPDWTHYRGEEPHGPFEIVDPGHDPVLDRGPGAKSPTTS